VGLVVHYQDRIFGGPEKIHPFLPRFSIYVCSHRVGLVNSLCRMSRPRTMYTTSSARFLTWSPIRSRYRATEVSGITRVTVAGSVATYAISSANKVAFN